MARNDSIYYQASVTAEVRVFSCGNFVCNVYLGVFKRLFCFFFLLQWILLT